jgi:2-polyprenyl-3-methyl-5-hydroxy-6-metoxy-1,4-benzoquinol methylase
MSVPTPISPVTGTKDVELVSEFSSRELHVLVKRVICRVQPLETLGTIRLWRCRASDLKFFDPMICGDDHFYEQLSKKYPWYYLSDKPEYRHAATLVTPGSRVLDVGCGLGEFAQHLPEGAIFQGIEATESVAVRAQQEGRAVLHCTIQAHAMEFEDFYDVVTSFQVLEHVQRPLDFTLNMLKCLKPGGLIVLAVPNDDSFAGTAVNNLLNLPPHHVSRWSPRALIYVLESLGAANVRLWKEDLSELHKLSYYHDLMMRAVLGARDKPLPVVKTDFWFRVISKLGTYAAVWLLRGDLPYRPGILGHTMIAIGEKPSSGGSRRSIEQVRGSPGSNRRHASTL